MGGLSSITHRLRKATRKGKGEGAKTKIRHQTKKNGGEKRTTGKITKGGFWARIQPPKKNVNARQRGKFRKGPNGGGTIGPIRLGEVSEREESARRRATFGTVRTSTVYVVLKKGWNSAHGLAANPVCVACRKKGEGGRKKNPFLKGKLVKRGGNWGELTH